MTKTKTVSRVAAREYARQFAVRYARFCAHVQAKQASLPRTDGSLSRRIESLLKDTTMSYKDIVATVRAEFPDANTTTKSVASVACTMRKKGVPVPLRLKLNLVAA